jgi:TRAP-type C4-dicarboxylate transport system substrate-binding protein
MPDAYQSLQKGVVDGCAHPMEANKGWKLGEVLKYVVDEDSVAYTTTFFVAMNKAKWDALSPEIQKTITEINAEWAGKHGEAWDSSDDEGRKFFEEKGGVIITLDDAERAKWKEAVKPAIDEYQAELDAKGINGAEVIKHITSMNQ